MPEKQNIKKHKANTIKRKFVNNYCEEQKKIKRKKNSRYR